jgi:predicted CoA-binding protein
VNHDLGHIFDTARHIAVLGAHPEMHRAAYYVPAYLEQHGYRIFPVNPVYAGSSLFGATVRATLTELDESIDVVDVFRRNEHLPAHLPEILAMKPSPRVVWLQLGVFHPPVERALEDAGIEVVSNLCMLAEHRRLRSK